MTQDFCHLLTDTKTCSKCGVEQSVVEYSQRKGSKDGLNGWCKTCYRLYNKKWFKSKDKKYRQDQWLKDRYGLSAEAYDALLVTQGGVCAICRLPQNEKNRRLCVDHDRFCCPSRKSCGKCVRGLLCGKCNKILGLIGDSSVWLDRLKEYLGEWNVRSNTSSSS